MTIMTRWRLYILVVLLLIAAAGLLFLRLLQKRGLEISWLRGAMFILGLLLTVESAIVMGLSNFNLGVILPGVLGLPLMILAFLLPHMTGGFLLLLKRLAAVGYGLAALLFLICGLCMLSVQRDGEKVEADAVIVLGAAVHGDRITWVLENRLNTALDFLNAHPEAICVVSGGQGPGESVTEGSAMKKYLLSQGLAPERIFAEERATNTPENFAYSMEILKDVLPEDARVAFVTTDFHVFRAERTAKKRGFDVIGIPAPDVWYLKLNNFMRESVGICVYALTGKI